jgi:phosphoribosylaminoimidazole-succinocarboxamide synthase
LEKISEGKTKIVYFMPEQERVTLKFKDDVTAFDGKKHDMIKDKGIINAAITAKLYRFLEKEGVPTHFIELKEPGVMIVRSLKMIPLEVVCRNIAAGHILERLPGFKKGDPFPKPIVEFFLKNDALHDPILNDDHIEILSLADKKEIASMKSSTLKANNFLMPYLAERSLILADFKLEFGRDSKGNLILGDELDCDSMRLWDAKTGEILDKDVYRQGSSLDKVTETYHKCYQRIVGEEFR